MANTHDHNTIVKDTDHRFIVNSKTREITTTSDKLVIIQHDHNSERFTFEIDKFIEEHDMGECTSVQVHFQNTDSADRTLFNKSFTEIVDTKQEIVDGEKEKVLYSWLVPNVATKYAGPLNISLSFVCTGADDYRWGTKPYNALTVSATMVNAVEDDDEEFLSEFEKAKETIINEVTATVMSGIEEAIDAQDALLQANIDAEVKARTEEDANIYAEIEKHLSGSEDPSTTYVKLLVEAEADARSKKDSELNNSIVANYRTMEREDGELNDKITAEVTARQTADETLQANIDAEATARESADAALQTSIDAEASVRATAISGLSEEIDSKLASSKTLKYTYALKLDNTRVYGDGNFTNTTPTETKPEPYRIHNFNGSVDSSIIFEFHIRDGEDTNWVQIVKLRFIKEGTFNYRLLTSNGLDGSLITFGVKKEYSANQAMDYYYLQVGKFQADGDTVYIDKIYYMQETDTDTSDRGFASLTYVNDQLNKYALASNVTARINALDVDKAEASDVAALTREVTTKVSKSDVDSELDADSTNPIQNGVVVEALNSKADISYVDEKIDQASFIVVDTEIDDTANPVENRAIKEALDLKVNLEDFRNMVSDMSNFADQLQRKPDVAYVDDQLDNKAGVEYVNEQLALKANTIDVDSALEKKADKSYVTEVFSTATKAANDYTDEQLKNVSIDTSVLDTKADISYVDEKLEEKADISYVDEAVANAGGSNITLDSELSETSENPVQNKVVTEALKDKLDKFDGSQETGSLRWTLYGQNLGEQVQVPRTSTPKEGAVAVYTSGDSLRTNLVRSPLDCTNKEYVDGKIEEVNETVDGKLDRYTENSYRIYASLNGARQMLGIANVPSVQNKGEVMTLCAFDKEETSVSNKGTFNFPDPLYPYQAANKQYVDGVAETKVDKPASVDTAYHRVYVVKRNSTEPDFVNISDSHARLGQGFIPTYVNPSSYGGNEVLYALMTCTPKLDYQAANKKYVDDAIVDIGGGVYLHKCKTEWLSWDSMSQKIFSFKAISGSSSSINTYEQLKQLSERMISGGMFQEDSWNSGIQEYENQATTYFNRIEINGTTLNFYKDNTLIGTYSAEEHGTDEEPNGIFYDTVTKL